MRWLLAPKPAGHSTLASWLDDVASSYGFSTRADFLSEQGVQNQSFRALCSEPSIPLLDLIAKRSTLTPEAVREMTLLCLHNIHDDDLRRPARQIGVINHASDHDEIAQIEALMKSGATIPLDRNYFSTKEILADFLQIKSKFHEKFTLHMDRMPRPLQMNDLIDLAYEFTNSGCGLKFINEGICIDSRASYLCSKFAYIYRRYAHSSEPAESRSEG